MTSTLPPLKFYMGQAQTLEGHTDFVEDLAVSPDGRRAVSASRDQTLRVWDLEAGRTVATFTAEMQYGVVRWHPTASPRSPAT